MPTRQKFNFYAVSNGKDIGVYTSWPQAAGAVLGFANAKYKGYITFTEAKSAMNGNGFEEFNVYDGQNTFTIAEYEGNRGEIMGDSNCDSTCNSTNEDTQVNLDENSLDEQVHFEASHEEGKSKMVTVYIDGSCIGNGGPSAKGGYGVFFGDSHPWNGSFTIPPEDGPTNNKAELMAAIEAIKIGHNNNVKYLQINSDSKYVVLGVTQWSQQWVKNGWRNSSGEAVRNKQEWEELLELVNKDKMVIEWNQVPAHSGIPGNEEADKLAVKGATQKLVTVGQEKGTAVKNIPDVEPKIIIVSNITENSHKIDNGKVEVKLNVTPQKKLSKDHTDTPVPGSINGYGVKTKLIVEEKQGVNAKQANYTKYELNLADKNNSSSLEPKIIIVPKNAVQSNKNDIKMVEVKLNVTPQKKVSKDLTNTPVPGSFNGSYVKKMIKPQQIINESLEKNLKNNQTASPDAHVNSQINQVMKNMQTVLESVLLELHQSKEDNVKLKKDVSSQLHDISSHQKNLGETLVKISKDLPNELQKCITKLTENQNSNSIAKEIPRLGEIKSIVEIQEGINSLQKNITHRFDTLKSSMQKIGTTCADLKEDSNARSTIHDSRFTEIQDLSQQIFETVSDVQVENRRTRDNLAEIEKSINVMSESADFQLVTKSKKVNKGKEAPNYPIKSNTAEIIVSDNEEEDTEVIFTKKRTDLASIQDSSATNKCAIDISPIQDSEVPNRMNSSSCSKEPQQEIEAQSSSSHSKEEQTHNEIGNKPTENIPKTDNNTFANRKPKVCLIGDSLVGQLNVPLLGKGTNTFVQRLKAPKILDIDKHTTEAKDAKVIIIHCGINNLRDKEQTESCVNAMVDQIKSLKLAAPKAKQIVSKVLPVGSRDLSVESSVFNAHLEKKLLEEHNDVTFISHSNLSDQGQIIKDNYREDQLHLSSRGVLVFGGNLHRTIMVSLNQKTEERQYLNQRHIDLDNSQRRQYEIRHTDNNRQPDDSSQVDTGIQYNHTRHIVNHRGKEDTRHIDNHRGKEDTRHIDNHREQDDTRHIDNNRQPYGSRHMDTGIQYNHTRPIDNHRGQEDTRHTDNQRQPDDSSHLDNGIQYNHTRHIDNHRRKEDTRHMDNHRRPDDLSNMDTGIRYNHTRPIHNHRGPENTRHTDNQRRRDDSRHMDTGIRYNHTRHIDNLRGKGDTRHNDNHRRPDDSRHMDTGIRYNHTRHIDNNRGQEDTRHTYNHRRPDDSRHMDTGIRYNHTRHIDNHRGQEDTRHMDNHRRPDDSRHMDTGIRYNHTRHIDNHRGQEDTRHMDNHRRRNDSRHMDYIGGLNHTKHMDNSGRNNQSRHVANGASFQRHIKQINFDHAEQLESDLTNKEHRDLYYCASTYNRQYSPIHRQYECGHCVNSDF